MTSKGFFRGCVAAAFFLTSGLALAQGNSQGHGRGHGHGHDRDDQGDHDGYYGHYYGEHREEIRHWYRDHDRDRDLPPGLAKRDRLPPGLERQLEVRGTLPPGLRKRIEPCPPELIEELPPPPPHCEHVIIGGHIVLLNRANFQIVDVFHFELN